MNHEESCPRCLQKISSQRAQIVPKVCDNCGFVLSKAELRGLEKLTSLCNRASYITAFIVLVLFMHISTWGKYSVEIIPLSVGHWMGSNSPDDTERLADICMDVKHYDCFERTYARIALLRGSNVTTYGKFLMSRGKFKEACDIFSRFFKDGHENLEVRSLYAKALGEVGRIDDASSLYEYIIRSRNDVLQVTVVQNYVKLLVRAERFERAKQVIQYVRKHAPGDPEFMETEFKAINAKLRKS